MCLTRVHKPVQVTRRLHSAFMPFFYEWPLTARKLTALQSLCPQCWWLQDNKWPPPRLPLLNPASPSSAPPPPLPHPLISWMVFTSTMAPGTGFVRPAATQGRGGFQDNATQGRAAQGSNSGGCRQKKTLKAEADAMSATSDD